MNAREARVLVHVIGVGGTISSAARDEHATVTPSLTASELVRALPEIRDVAEVETADFEPRASTAVTFASMVEVASTARSALDKGCDGIVVTHGTGTLEETAYALALMLPRSRPIAITGAMRNPTLPGSDGAANLLAAVRVAAHAPAAVLGPVVVVNDEVHAARWATKGHSTRLATFESPGAGPVGELVEDRVEIWFTPAWEDYVGLPPTGEEPPRVELVKAFAGMDDVLLRAAIEQQPAAIVIEAIGPGTLPPTLLPAIDVAIERQIPVVIATRCQAGRNYEHTYRMPGSEVDLAQRGALFAGYLSGPKARVRLLVGISLGRSPQDLFPA